MRYHLTRPLGLLIFALLLYSTAFSQRPELIVDRTSVDRLRVFAFSPDGKVFVTVTADNAIRLWAVASGKNIGVLKGQSDRITTVAFSGDLVLSGSADGTVRLWRVPGGDLIMTSRPHSQAISQVAFSPGGNYFVSASLDDTINIWSTEPLNSAPIRTIRSQKAGVTTIAMSPDGKYVAGGGRNSEIKIFDIELGIQIKALQGHTRRVSALAFNQDGQHLASASLDDTIKIWSINGPSQPLEITTSARDTESLAFSPDGRGIISSAYVLVPRPTSLVFSLTPVPDGSTTQTSTSPTRELCTVYSFRDNSWAVIDTEGRYDASFGGDIPWLKWKFGQKLVALSQLKSAFYEPGLLAKLLGVSKEPLSPVTKLTEIKPHPDVVVDAPVAGTLMSVTLKNNGGGIGRVQVKLNNTEIYEDARGAGFAFDRPNATLTLDLSSPALIEGKLNKIQVIAWNSAGYLSSPTETAVEWKHRRSGRGPASVSDDSPPEFHAIVVGTSEYAESSVRLKYAARDAEAMAQALGIGAKRLFPGEGRIQGRGRVHITLLRSFGTAQTDPTKANITRAFEEARRSRPQDLLVVYLSGHGLALRGEGVDASKTNQLYAYLTKEARSKNPDSFNLPDVVKGSAVTSEELARWIREIPAQRRVLILDTCAAGAASSDLNAKGDEVSFYQIKALDKLKDRTGFFVLMGSAANSVSWEASSYGQGLLTFALLTKMKATEPARDETEVDVSSLFQYAVENVPQLALGLGGVQQPEIMVPQGSASFPIGLLKLQDKNDIPLQQKKPVVLSPILLDRQDMTDEGLQLTRALSKKLDEETYVRAKGSAFQSEVVYVEVSRLQGAYLPTGTYVVEGNSVQVDLVLSRDGKKIRLSIKGFTDKVPELVATIVDRILEEVVKAQTAN